MAELEQSIVSLLEEHVELAISTVQELRTEKLELEAEIARLNNDAVQRDAHIQELEQRNRDLEEELNLEQLAISQERTDVRERLEGLMAVLAVPNEAQTETEAETHTGRDMAFTTVRNEGERTVVVRPTENLTEE